jgi:hypothetical protein
MVEEGEALRVATTVLPCEGPPAIRLLIATYGDETWDGSRPGGVEVLQPWHSRAHELKQLCARQSDRNSAVMHASGRVAIGATDGSV